MVLISDMRSVSQYNSYQQCPEQYRLERIEKVWQRPAAWLPQGSAVHEAAEAFEKSLRTLSDTEIVDVFADSYVKHVNRMCAETPNLDTWFNSGPYRGAEDIERRFSKGREQTLKYRRYYNGGEGSAEPIVYIDDEPMIESYFKIDLDGVAVRGYIDAVVDRADKIHVRDNKTGKQPGGAFQLGVYAQAVRDAGLACDTGDYWMGETGKPSKTHDLSVWDREALTAEFRWLDDKITAGDFTPKPKKSLCARCPVASSCSYRADR